MPKTMLLEEFHLTIRAPVGLSEAEYVAMLRTLRSKRYQTRLHDAMREILQRHPSLAKVQLAIDR